MLGLAIFPVLEGHGQSLMEEVMKMSLGSEDLIRRRRNISVTKIGSTALMAKLSRICVAGFVDGLETPLLLMRHSG